MLTALQILAGVLGWIAGLIALMALVGSLAGHSSERADAEAFLKFDRERDLL